MEGTQMTEAYDWRGRNVVGADGEKIGKLSDVYLDEQTGKPEWALVNTGLFGTKSNFVPLTQATPSGESVEVPFTKDQVTGAPGVEPDGALSQQEEAQLFEHYEVPYDESGTVTAKGAPSTADAGGDPTDEAMTRSEEEVRVGTAKQERGRVRLRKYVVTEQVQQTVPVRREEVRLEREPITDANVDQATEGPEISEDEHEVVLHEEQPVVEKRTVPKERVRLEKDTVTEEQQVTEEVRKEQIDTEGDVPR